MHHDDAPDTLSLLHRQYLPTDVCQQVKHLPMAPYMQRMMKLQSHPHHPYAAQEMVGVGVGHEEVVDILAPHTRPLQLREHTIAPTGIHHQHRPATAMQREARVVASGCQCVACAEHGDEVVLVLHFNLLNCNLLD